jgi:Xaa-Pro aminopeptidase
MHTNINNRSVTIKSLSQRDSLKDSWLLERLTHLLPSLMARHEFDMWITIGKEYHEDPISLTLFPSSIDSSRRLTIFAFVKEKTGELRRFVIHPNKEFQPFYSCFPLMSDEVPLEGLKRMVETYHPKKIGINCSSTYAFCDGLSHSLYEDLVEILGDHYKEKLVTSEPIALDWLQLRTDSELETYKELAQFTKIICGETLSNEVITPGKTTTKEVVEWIRQKVLDLGLTTSFYPTVDIQRRGATEDRLSGTILPGDIVHLDFGIHYLGLCTDTQQLAYVLLPDENEPPEGLADALKIANQFEDIFFEACTTGRTGNEIFQDVMMISNRKGIKPMLYSHPIGFHCHGAGPIIGLFDKQEEIPVRGEVPLQNNTCYAMEFNIKKYVPEWKETITFFLEESVCFYSNKMHYLTQRQTEFYKISTN